MFSISEDILNNNTIENYQNTSFISANITKQFLTYDSYRTESFELSLYNE